MTSDLSWLTEDVQGALEVLETNPLFHEIPIAGRVLRAIKTVRSFRDQLFARKIAKFLEHPEFVNDRARDRMRALVENSPHEAQRVGETLFLILERITDMQKPAWLSALFAAFLAGEMTAAEWRRAANAIDSAFADDIAGLLASSDDANILSHQELDLTRFRGHLMVSFGGVHNGEQIGPVYPGVQAADGGFGAIRAYPGVPGEGVRPDPLVDLPVGQAGRPRCGQGRWWADERGARGAPQTAA